MNKLSLIALITIIGCAYSPVKKSGYALKTFSIGRLDLKLPGHYSIHYPKDSNELNKIYFRVGDTIVLEADKDFFGYLGNISEYADNGECLNQLDTIGDMLIFISTAEIDDPFNSYERLENGITVSFIDLNKYGFDFSLNAVDSTSRYVLLGFRKSSGCYLSKTDRDELISAVRQSTMRKE